MPSLVYFQNVVCSVEHEHFKYSYSLWPNRRASIASHAFPSPRPMRARSWTISCNEPRRKLCEESKSRIHHRLPHSIWGTFPGILASMMSSDNRDVLEHSTREMGSLRHSPTARASCFFTFTCGVPHTDSDRGCVSASSCRSHAANSSGCGHPVTDVVAGGRRYVNYAHASGRPYPRPRPCRGSANHVSRQ